MGVAPAGKSITSPFGVMAKIRSLKKSIFKDSRNSSGWLKSFCQFRSCWTQPSSFLSPRANFCSFSLFIKPVGGNAGFGFLVHFLGADLNFSDFVANAKNRGVDATVAIGFGQGDI